MNESRKTKISKFLSLILRHSPETINLKLEEDGWVSVSELVKACADAGKSFTLAELREIVETSDKKRFSFDETGEKIRANQGHSLQIKIDFEKRMPPKILYHGTAAKNVASILKDGLKKMNRHHVHLSDNTETARNVGMRYGAPVIFKVDSGEMTNQGFEFFISTNGVWLIESVPPEFLEIIEKIN